MNERNVVLGRQPLRYQDRPVLWRNKYIELVVAGKVDAAYKLKRIIRSQVGEPMTRRPVDWGQAADQAKAARAGAKTVRCKVPAGGWQAGTQVRIRGRSYRVEGRGFTHAAGSVVMLHPK